MTPQGSEIFDAEYFSKLTERVNGATNCEELQLVTNDVMLSIAALKAAINDQLSKINIILPLLTPPGANLSAIVSWITNFINGFLTPMTLPTVNFPTILVDLALQITNLTNAINLKKGEFPNCSINIPPTP
jgi:hypothetical protein